MEFQKLKTLANASIAALNDKNLYHFAASLSFHSTLAFIPFLFISLSLFMQLPSFAEYSASFENFIAESLIPVQKEQAAQYISSFVANSNKLGIVGIVAMFFTTIMFFADFEYVVTRISNTEPRPFFLRLSIFWTLLTLMPLGLAFSVWLSEYLDDLLATWGIGIKFLAIFPYLILWCIFGITYGVCVNRKLKLLHIVVSSFAASVAWNISKLLFITYTFYNKSYTSIYGSMSILLFFFLWLYFSWIIFLFGLKLLAKLSANYWNSSDFEAQNEGEK